MKKPSPSKPLDNDVSSPKGPNESIWDRTAGVPRRFSIGTGMLITALYALLFGTLTSLGAPPWLLVEITLFLTGIGFTQTLMYGGKRPRRASFVAGAFLLPVFVAVTIVVEASTNGWRGGPEDLILAVIFSALFAMVLGPWLGYVSGILTAGLFVFLRRDVEELQAGAGSCPVDTTDTTGREARSNRREVFRYWPNISEGMVGLLFFQALVLFCAGATPVLNSMDRSLGTLLVTFLFVAPTLVELVLVGIPRRVILHEAGIDVPVGTWLPNKGSPSFARITIPFSSIERVAVVRPLVRKKDVAIRLQTTRGTFHLWHPHLPDERSFQRILTVLEAAEAENAAASDTKDSLAAEPENG